MAMDTDAIRALYAETSLGGPDQAVGFVLWRVMHRYQRAVDRSLQPHGLTHLQFTTLAIVGWMCRTDARATQVELAREADIHPMQVSLMLKALEAKCMVIRSRSSVDTRARSVDITQTGLEALRQAFPVVISIQQRMFGEAGAPGGTLHRALRKVEKRDAP